MESLSDTKWDVVISGTGLQQSLLALALSRSGKNILHVDHNAYYGGSEAAFSLQEVDEWADSKTASSVFSNIEIFKAEQGLSNTRAYSIALAPQIIHTKSKLLAQLVSSKAFRQIEFLAVGSFYIFQPASSASAAVDSEVESKPTLSRIPSTREDVFSNTSIPARAKRSLMKFLKFVLEYDSEPQTELWAEHAEEPLADFLANQFKLDERLQADVVTLTLSLDGSISVADGLAAIHKHMTSMGLFGAGFAAVYPKWGGLSEVAQVGCRAGAVGGAIYTLGTGVSETQSREDPETPLTVSLSSKITVDAKKIVQESDNADPGGVGLSRLTAVVNSGLAPVFEVIVEGAPTPAVAVVAFSPKQVSLDNGDSSEYPIYAMVHSSETGECPTDQSLIYLSTISTPSSNSLLEKALSLLLDALSNGQPRPECLYKLSYEQKASPGTVAVEGSLVHLPPVPPSLAFDDSLMDQVQIAWEAVTKDDEAVEGAEYMTFADRESGGDDDDPYE